MKKLLIPLFVMWGTAFGYYPYHKSIRPSEYQNIRGEITDTAADFWWVYYTGVGNLADIVVSNTAQSGVFARPPTCPIRGFDATFEQWIEIINYYSSATVGKTGEYPISSWQYYIWASGVWVGALYPVVDSLGDTTWKPNVSKGAYYSDMGGMSIPELDSVGEVGNVGGRGLAFSDQIIPDTFPHAGERLFVQPGETPQPYQALWPFADTSLNSKRPPAQQLDPANGDIVSDEDSYGVAGDWIPDSEASVIWVRDSAIGPYDVWGLGIRLEQRTYSFKNKDYVYINYKIRNMNPFPLRNIYCGYFMDNDVGRGTADPNQGYKDDLVGYYKPLKLGFTYDSDGYEPGWAVPPGYIGCILLETPGDIGFTGFQTWPPIVDSTDYDGKDSLKYEKLKDTLFCVCDSPCDVRHLSSSGPYPILQPGEEVDFTVAVVAGLTLSHLFENAQDAITLFNNGYVVGVEESHLPIPEKYALFSNSPNPFKFSTEIRYAVPKSSWVNLSIYNLAGQKVVTLVNKNETLGYKKIRWDGRDNRGEKLRSGVYFYKLTAEDFTQTNKFILVE